MTTIDVTLRTGERRTLPARLGNSVMETLRDGGVDEILAICGGSMACATCHVYLDAADYDRCPPPSGGESELLEFADHRTELSRLSCQLKIGPQLHGVHVTVAPED